MTNVSLLESIPENGIFLFGGVGGCVLSVLLMEEGHFSHGSPQWSKEKQTLTKVSYCYLKKKKKSPATTYPSHASRGISM